jgi:hypothetical protein
MLRVKLKSRNKQELRSFDASDLLGEELQGIDGKVLYIFDFDGTIIDGHDLSPDAEQLYPANIMRQRAYEGNRVIILTARPDIDNVRKYLEANNLSDVEVFSSHSFEKEEHVGTALGKQAFMRDYLDKNNYIKKIYFYDDKKANLDRVKELEGEYDISVSTHLVDEEEDQNLLKRGKHKK